MIKRSAILLLLLAAGSFSLLIFSSYSSAASSNSPVKSTPVKCSGQCKKKEINRSGVLEYDVPGLISCRKLINFTVV